MNRFFVARTFFLLAVLLYLPLPPLAFGQLTKVKTSYSALTANMAAYWLAKETRLFEKHGLDVDVVLIESGVTTVQALTAGETQIAMGGGTVAVSSNLAGSDIVSIASIESRLALCLAGAERDQNHRSAERKAAGDFPLRQRLGSGRAPDSPTLWSGGRQGRHHSPDRRHKHAPLGTDQTQRRCDDPHAGILQSRQESGLHDSCGSDAI